jgi:2-oxoglutarate ferredoxin oxidoreductase subunit beta
MDEERAIDLKNGKFKRNSFILDEPLIYCPGCTHGIAHRLLAEVIDELGISERSIGVSSIGCSVRIWKFLNFDFVQGAHGRGMAVATGIKRSNPDKVVFTYQGDGDLAAIGMGETIHAIARGEKITTIFINNSVFGATGGQLAPTTLLGQKTVTYPEGRREESIGNPIRFSELLSSLDSNGYIARVAANTPSNIKKTKEAIRKAFEAQISGKGYGLVEILGCCPSNLKMSPVDSMRWIGTDMIPYYPLGEFKKV